MKFEKKYTGFTPTPILKKINMSLANRKFLSPFSDQTRGPLGIGVSLHSKRGFTVIEIVIVIGIMAMFSALIYSSFDTSRARSRDQKRISDISVIQIALEQYFQKNAVYPQQLSALVPTYISTIPTDQNNIYNNNYFPLTKISGSNNCISYQLWTKFELNNEYLLSKKSFNSQAVPTSAPYILYECGTGHNRINASNDQLVFDVMP